LNFSPVGETILIQLHFGNLHQGITWWRLPKFNPWWRSVIETLD